MWEALEEGEESKCHSFSNKAKNIWVSWESNEANPLKNLKIILETMS